MILLINAVPIATVLKEIYRKFKISRINHRMNRVEVLVAYK